MDNGRLSLSWWGDVDKDEDRGRLMVEAAKQIWNLPGEMLRRDLDVTNVRMYEQTANASLSDFGGKFFASAGATGETVQTGMFDPREASTYNVAKSAIDTMASQIASTDQRARFITVDGNPMQRRRARKKQAFSDGLALDLKLHRARQRAWYDAAVTESGVGALQFYQDVATGRCAVQRVIPTELAIDPLDGWVDGKPKTIYRRTMKPRSWVRAMFGGKDAYAGKLTEDAIDNARTITSGNANHSDQVEVWEGWHLATSPESKDGWHCVALDHTNGTLEVKQFTAKRHRVVFFSLEDRFATPWGNSPMSQVRPLQTQININLLRIARAQKLFSAGHLYIDRTAKIRKSALSNEIGSVWEGTGPNPPQKISFEAATAEMYQQVDRDAQRIFDVLGINRGSSVGDTSRGAGAPAAAMREETQKADKRNSPRQQRWEQFHLDCIEVAIDVVREITENGKSSYVVSVPKGSRANAAGMSVVDFKEAALDEDKYVLQIKPSSPYPTDPPGLIALAYDMIELKAWQGKDVARYFSSLDADAMTDREDSQSDNLQQTFDKLLYEANYVAVPNEFTDAQLAIELGAQYLAMAEADGVEPRAQQKLIRYLRKCQKLLDKAQAKAQAAAQPPAPPQQAAA